VFYGKTVDDYVLATMDYFVIILKGSCCDVYNYSKTAFIWTTSGHRIGLDKGTFQIRASKI
jgi:hypothetical protein